MNAFTKAITDRPMKLDIKAPGVTPQANQISVNFNYLEEAIDTFEDEGARKLTTVQQQEACKLCLKTFSLGDVNAQVLAFIVMQIKTACTKEGEETPSDFRKLINSILVESTKELVSFRKAQSRFNLNTGKNRILPIILLVLERTTSVSI